MSRGGARSSSRDEHRHGLLLLFAIKKGRLAYGHLEFGI